jgi:hypothetical protein
MTQSADGSPGANSVCEGPMLAIGCLLPLILLAAGGGIGIAAGSTAAGVWGGAAGFIVGCVALVGLLWGFERIKNR